MKYNKQLPKLINQLKNHYQETQVLKAKSKIMNLIKLKTLYK